MHLERNNFRIHLQNIVFFVYYIVSSPRFPRISRPLYTSSKQYCAVNIGPEKDTKHDQHHIFEQFTNINIT